MPKDPKKMSAEEVEATLLEYAKLKEYEPLGSKESLRIGVYRAALVERQQLLRAAASRKH